MLKDGRGANSLVVYLDVPDAGDHKSLADARRDTVAAYLGSRGLSQDSFRLERGINPDSTFPAVPSRRAKAPAEAPDEPAGPDQAPSGMRPADIP
jgi:hypothetical protein